MCFNYLQILQRIRWHIPTVVFPYPFSFFFFFFSKTDYNLVWMVHWSIMPIDTTSKQGTENFAAELNTGMEIPSSLSECAQKSI